MSLYKGNTLISGVIPNSANQSLSNLNSAGQDKFDAKANTSLNNLTSTSSTNFDGDWNTVAFNVISSATTINATTTKDFTLSTIPSDGYKYEIIFTIQGQTPATSGSGSRIGVGSSLTQVASNIVAANIARSAATQYWAASGNIIIGTDRKIYVRQIDNSSTTVSNFKVMSYRRIGTNA